MAGGAALMVVRTSQLAVMMAHTVALLFTCTIYVQILVYTKHYNARSSFIANADDYNLHWQQGRQVQ